MLFLQLLLSVSSLFNFTIQPAGVRTGTWRGVLTTNGGELPFNFEIKLEGDNLYLEIMNGEERIKVDEVNVVNDSIFIRMPVFDSEFHLKYGTETMTGLYINHARKEKNIFPFKAEFGKTYSMAAWPSNRF
jgi:hypothetical protein